MKTCLKFAALAPVLLLTACVSMPSGPSQMSIPGTGKDFNQFQADDAQCRQFALSSVGGKTPDQAAADSGVASAVVGAAIGAAAGAAINGGQGAAIGAGAGGATGALVGTGTGAQSSYALQQRYDNAYLQCMYAKGNKIPVYGAFAAQNTAPAPRAPQGYYYPPPPPPGWR
jgi:outer membrane lipoprotein SlyB